MSKCPHCSENIESLSGFVPQADLEERLNTLKSGKDNEISALTTSLQTAQAKASGYDAVVNERNALMAKDEARVKKDARTGLFTEAKVDPALLESFEQAYGWSQNGVADDAKKNFETWFAEDAANHVLLKPHFNGAAPPPPAPNPEVGSGNNTIPPVPPAHAPPPPPHNGKFTNVDIQAVFQSSAFQALSLKDKQAKLARMEAGDMT